MKKCLVFYLGILSSVAFAGFDGRLARNSVIDALSGLLPTGDKDNDKRINKGIVHLQNGLHEFGNSGYVGQREKRVISLF